MIVPPNYITASGLDRPDSGRQTQSVIGPTRQARNLGERRSRKNQKNHLGLGSSNGKNGHSVPALPLRRFPNLVYPSAGAR
jgi:hypothetical protein